MRVPPIWSRFVLVSALVGVSHSFRVTHSLSGISVAGPPRQERCIGPWGPYCGTQIGMYLETQKTLSIECDCGQHCCADHTGGYDGCCDDGTYCCIPFQVAGSSALWKYCCGAAGLYCCENDGCCQEGAEGCDDNGKCINPST